MILFDYVVIGILVLSVALSVVRGLVKEILSLANWIIAFYVANHYGPDLVVYVPAVQGMSEPMKMLAGCAAAFVGSMVIGGIFTWFVSRLISAMGLSFADRGLGGAFGAARGAVIVLTAVTAAGLTSLPQQDFWRNALLSPFAENAVRTVKPHLPEDLAKWVRY